MENMEICEHYIWCSSSGNVNMEKIEICEHCIWCSPSGNVNMEKNGNMWTWYLVLVWIPLLPVNDRLPLLFVITEVIYHCNDVIMIAMASHITSVSIVCSTVGPGADQRKNQSSASLAFVWGINRWPVNSPYKRQVTRKMFPFDDAIMANVKSLIQSGFSNGQIHW